MPVRFVVEPGGRALLHRRSKRAVDRRTLCCLDQPREALLVAQADRGVYVFDDVVSGCNTLCAKSGSERVLELIRCASLKCRDCGSKIGEAVRIAEDLGGPQVHDVDQT